MDEDQAVKMNIIRGILVGVGGTIRSILLPLFIFTQVLLSTGLVAGMLAGMMGGGGEGPSDPLISTTGDIAAIVTYILWFGVLSVAFKAAKAFSPKRSGSWRREVLSLAGTALRIPGLYILILTGCNIYALSLMGMVTLTIDLTAYIVALMGFVLIRMIPDAIALIESFVVAWRMKKED
jgi:hypothetical protein